MRALSCIQQEDAFRFLERLNEHPKLILTDPPYGMNYRTNMPGDKRWNSTGQPLAERHGGKGRFSPMLNDQPGAIDLGRFSRLCFEKLADDSHLLVFASWRSFIEWSPLIEEAGFTLWTPVIWNKKCANGGDLRDPLSSVAEYVVHGVKGHPTSFPLFNAEGELKRRVVNVWHHGRVPKAEYCGHPTQKPLFTCEQLIRMTTEKNDLVVDPFCGSGTVPLAAARLGRRYAACDLDPEYAAVARRRLTAALDCPRVADTSVVGRLPCPSVSVLPLQKRVARAEHNGTLRCGPRATHPEELAGIVSAR